MSISTLVSVINPDTFPGDLPMSATLIAAVANVALTAEEAAYALRSASYYLPIIDDCYLDETVVDDDADASVVVVGDEMTIYRPIVCRECRTEISRHNPRILPRTVQVGGQIVKVGFTYDNAPYHGADVWVGIEGTGVTVTIDPDKATASLVEKAATALALLS
jgi:hypothetical protein